MLSVVPRVKTMRFRRRSEVAGQPLARAFEGGRRPIAQFMQSSVDIAIIVLVEA